MAVCLQGEGVVSVGEQVTNIPGLLAFSPSGCLLRLLSSPQLFLFMEGVPSVSSICLPQ